MRDAICFAAGLGAGLVAFLLTLSSEWFHRHNPRVTICAKCREVTR